MAVRGGRGGVNGWWWGRGGKYNRERTARKHNKIQEFQVLVMFVLNAVYVYIYIYMYICMSFIYVCICVPMPVTTTQEKVEVQVLSTLGHVIAFKIRWQILSRCEEVEESWWVVGRWGGLGEIVAREG